MKGGAGYAKCLLLLCTAFLFAGGCGSDLSEKNKRPTEYFSVAEPQADAVAPFEPMMSEFLPEITLLLEPLHTYILNIPEEKGIRSKVALSEAERVARLAALSVRLYFSLVQQDRSQAASEQKLLRSYLQSIEIPALQSLADASLDNLPIDSLLKLARHSLMLDPIQAYLLKHYHSPYLASTFALSAWLEQLYLACLVYEHYPKPSVQKHIAEQKLLAGNLAMLLSFYEEQPPVARLLKKLSDLLSHFDGVVITYNYRKPSTSVEGNVLVVRQNDAVNFQIEDADIQALRKGVEDLRRDLLKLP